MPTAVENYIFNELPRRVVIDSSIPTGSNFTAAWLLVATGVGSQVIPVDPATLGFEPEVTPPGVNPEIKFWNGNKDWIEISAAAIGAIPASEKGQALGVATLDADGYVQLSQMNPAVIERVVAVADEAARYALTIADVQNGDVVNQQSPLPATMWYVVDDTNLNNSSGYLPFSAGVAASVAWSGITGKPAIIGDLENISLAAEGDLIQFVAGNWVNVDVASLKADLALEIVDIDLLQDALDAKQDQSTILDNLSAISTRGVVVRTSDGEFIGREVVGVNGIDVTEGKGDADNISLSLTEVGVAGTYGDNDTFPTYEVDAYGRIISTTVKSLVKDTLTLLDQVADQTLVPNTTYQIGAYVEALNLLVPDPVVGGTKITLEVPMILGTPVGNINISFPSGKELFGFAPSISLKSMMNPLPGDSITFTYIDNLSQWVAYKSPGLYLRELYLVGDSTANPNLEPSYFHSVSSKATDSRVLIIPDRDVDLSSVGQTEFTSSEFSVVDSTDPSKKVAFSVGSVGAGNTSIITVPDSPIDLGKVAQAASTSTDGYLTATDWNTFSSSKYFYELLNTAGSTRATPLEVGKSYRLSGSATAVAESTPIFLPSATQDAFGNANSAPISFVVGDNSVSGRGFLLSAQPGQGILYIGSTGIVTGPLIGAANPTAPTEATAVWVPNLSSVTCYMIANGYWFVSILHGSNRMPSDKLFLVDPLDATKRAKFITSGIGTSQTRSITIPDANIDLGKLANLIPEYTASTAYKAGDLVKHQGHNWTVLIDHTGAIPFVDGNLELLGQVFTTPVILSGTYLCQQLGAVGTGLNLLSNKLLIVTYMGGGPFTLNLNKAPRNVDIRLLQGANLDITLTRSGVDIIEDGSGTILGTNTATIRVVGGSTISLVNYDTQTKLQTRVNNSVNTFTLIDPTTNGLSNKGWKFAGSASQLRTITLPDASINLGNTVTAAQINWGFAGFGTTPAGLTLTTASGAISQVDMSSVIVSSENLVNGLVHGTRRSARYIVGSASTFNVDLNTLALPYYVQFEANHGGGTATLVITIAGISTFLDAKSCTSLGGSPLTIKITPGEVITIRMSDSLTYAIVDRSLDVGIASNNRVSSGYRAVFRAPDDFTANRTITVPDANVNLGDLPSIATNYRTGSMAGTRSQCVGGSLNVFNGGTDNVAIGSTSCALHGTSNSVISSETTAFTASSSKCVVLGGNYVTLDVSTRVAAINSRFCNVYGTDNAVINTAYGSIGASATNSAIIGGYGVSGQINYIGNTGVNNVNYIGSVSCAASNYNVDVTLVNCQKVLVTSGQKRLTALNVTKLSDASNIPFPDTTFLVGTNGYLKATVKLYAVTAADTVAVEALADNATFPTTNKLVKSYITANADLQGIGRVLHKVSVAIRDNTLGSNVTFATRYVATAGDTVILAPTANGTTDINIGSGLAFSLTAYASGGALHLSVTSTDSVASTAVLLVESEYF